MTDVGTPSFAGHGASSDADRIASLLDAVFANAAVGIASWDLALRFERVNDELAAINGMSAEAHVGRTPAELLPTIGARVEADLRQVLETGLALRDVPVEGETPAAPGVTRFWLADYFPVRDPTGIVVGLAALVVEVTDERRARVRADAALQRSAFVDAELQSLYSALPVGVAFLGPDLRYQRVNETLARINGRPVSAHIGASLSDILGDLADSLETSLRQVMETRQPLELEVNAALPEGSSDVRALEATYFPVVDGGGELLGVGAVVRDVTHRHELELEQSRLLRDALIARADAEAAQVRTDDAREEADLTGAEARRAHARMALLADAGQRMAESMDWATTVRATARSVVPEIADWASVTVVEPDGRLRVVAVAHRDPELQQIAQALADDHVSDPDALVGSGFVIRTRRMQVLSDISPDTVRASADGPEHLALLEALNFKHVAIAPLETPAGIIGALTFVLGDSGRSFSPEDLQLIEAVAGRAALHIYNARLYTERSHIASTLQASLLPSALPEIPGATVAARYRAAGDHNTVGGDFYDIFRSGEAVWTVIVGDVSGKGAEAAAITALARHTLRTASRLDGEPASNLALLNQALHEDAHSTAFCTVVYALMCPGDIGFDVRFANGGHPPPLLLRVDGTVESIESGRGSLVGAVPEARFTEATLRLAPGELLLLYTDGLTEVRTDDVMFGERDLRATLAAQAGASADEVVAAIERRAVELQAGKLRDDLAIVAIQVNAVTPPPGTLRT